MVTIISATNRPLSNTLKTAQYYQKTLAAKGLETNLLSLEDLPQDFLFSDLYGKRSAAFQKIQDIISATEKFIFVIPEYNGGFPGVLKLFVDGCAFPQSFYEKKAALVGVSSGRYGNIRGIEHFTGICNYIHLHVMPLRLHLPAIATEFDESGNFFKEDTVKFTNEQMDKFIKF